MGQEDFVGLDMFFEYSITPDLDLGQMELYSLGFGLPILKDRFPTVLKVGYENRIKNGFNIESIFSNDRWDDLHTVEVEAISNFKVGRRMEIQSSIKPLISSNLLGAINSSDWFLGYNLVLKRNLKRMNISLGVERSARLGSFRHLPILLLETEIRPGLKVTAGYPYSSLEFCIRNKHVLKAQMEYSGRSYHLQKDDLISFETTESGELSYSFLDFSLLHSFTIGSSLHSTARLGYATNNNWMYKGLVSGNQQYNSSNSLYFSMGLNFRSNK